MGELETRPISSCARNVSNMYLRTNIWVQWERKVFGRAIVVKRFHNVLYYYIV